MAGLALAAWVPGADADVFTFATPTGATTSGGPVNADATVTTGAGTVTVVLADLEVNPTDVGQLLSGFDFVLSNGATTGTLASQSGQQINIAGDGTFSVAPGNPTGWQLNSNVGGGIQISALGGGSPDNLIIGPPGPGNVYSAANSSIAGNGPHNPFINQVGTFVVDVAGVTAETSITNVTFSFGTTAGSDIPVGVPEPSSLLSLLMLGGAGLVFRKRLGGAFRR